MIFDIILLYLTQKGEPAKRSMETLNLLQKANAIVRTYCFD